MQLNEKQLADRFRCGEAGSFESLYREFGPRLYRFCLRLCGDVSCAEDLTQEVFLAAFRGAERFEARSSIATWLYRIALYRWRHSRDKSRINTVSLQETDAPLSADPAQIGLEKVALDAALAALPDPLRVAFLLVKAEGFLCREAAEILGVPESTLKSRVALASHKLQALLSTDEREVQMPQSRCEIGEIP